MSKNNKKIIQDDDVGEMEADIIKSLNISKMMNNKKGKNENPNTGNNTNDVDDAPKEEPLKEEIINKEKREVEKKDNKENDKKDDIKDNKSENTSDDTSIQDIVNEFVAMIDKLKDDESKSVSSFSQSTINTKKGKIKFEDKCPKFTQPLRGEYHKLFDMLNDNIPSMKKYEIFELVLYTGLKNIHFD